MKENEKKRAEEEEKALVSLSQIRHPRSSRRRTWSLAIESCYLSWLLKLARLLRHLTVHDIIPRIHKPPIMSVNGPSLERKIDNEPVC